MREVWMTNRDVKRMPKTGLFYCDKCDRNKIGSGEKCSVCGYKDKRKRNKK